ncbi:unnamed protein product [Sphagnum troendelagicum]|uniref:ATP synthase F0 subunit 6 n=1 Tax=Sphagnum troendelagicum TaxID=128251 RepID=A0ABP0U7P8_9BRYO
MCFTFFFSILLCTFLSLEFPSCFIPTTTSALFMCMLWFYSYFAFTFVLTLLMCLLQFCSCVYSNFAYVSILISFMHFYPMFTFVSLLQLHSYIYSNLICFYFSSLVSFLHQSFSFALAFVLTSLLQLQTFACFNFTLVCSNFVLTRLLPCHNYVQVLSNLLLLNLYLA